MLKTAAALLTSRKVWDTRETLNKLVLIFTLRQRHDSTNAHCKNCGILRRRKLERCTVPKLFRPSWTWSDRHAHRRKQLVGTSVSCEGRWKKWWNLSCDHFQRAVFCNKFHFTRLLRWEFSHSGLFFHFLLVSDEYLFFLKKKSRRLKSKSFTALDFSPPQNFSVDKMKTFFLVFDSWLNLILWNRSVFLKLLMRCWVRSWVRYINGKVDSRAMNFV